MNLRTGERLGKQSEFRVELDPWQPALFAVTAEEVNGDVVKELLR